MKKWIVYPKKASDIVDQLLINRGIKNKNQFLNPHFERDLLDPFQISGMTKAIARIQQAIQTKEKIGIFADYDADGIPGAALLYNALTNLGLEIFTYIPYRTEGYGLNKKGILELKEKGCKLLITIDLGITNKNEVKFAKKHGLDVIVTDHHEIKKTHFPENADVVLHTHLGKKYANKDLAGGALAFKILQALSLKYGKPTEKELKWFLDLPAISTICDIVPLTGENRVIAKYGLIVLAKTKNQGLKELYKIASIDSSTIDTYKVGFLIGPRINAPSRMKYGKYSYDLLIQKNPDKITSLAKKINEINIERQKTLQEIVAESKSIVQKEKLYKHKIIIVRNEKWPLGLLGLIASKIADEFTRPAIALNKEDDTFRGSVRSIEGINIMEILRKVEVDLKSYGGHAQAAGVSIEQKNYHKFEKKIITLCDSEIDASKLIKIIKIDCELNLSDINFRLLNYIKDFEPFGLGNPKPVFLVKNILIHDIKWLGKEKNHLKLKIKSQKSNKIIDCIMFNCLEFISDIQIGDCIDLVFSLEDNVWNGNHNLQLKIVDLRKI